MPNCDGLLNAINAYIAKADKDLADTLDGEGFASSAESVELAARLEDDIADALKSEDVRIVSAAKDAVDLESFASDVWPDIRAKDDLRYNVMNVVQEQLSDFVPKLISTYIAQTDKRVGLTQISAKTTAWVSDWSEELGGLMKLNTHTEIEGILKAGLEKGSGIQEFVRAIMDSDIRDTQYKARRVAITEVLRAHSVAQEESIQQSPAVSGKEWLHTGGHLIAPRQNHVDMDGQIVDKDSPFELLGADGMTYYPQYPRDTILPPGESVNCHCIHTGVVSEDVLGLSLDERKQLQEEAIAEMDDDWEKELDAKNRAKAGIDGKYDYETMRNAELDAKWDAFQGMSRDKQSEYFYGSKPKMALYDAGIITNGKTLAEVRAKTFTNLRERGIIVVPSAVRSEAVVGNYTNLRNPNKPPGGNNGGNPRCGMHGQSGITELEKRGFTYEVTKTYDNGVRVGNIQHHVDRGKREESGQSWFPESWSDDDIHAAATYVANERGGGVGEVNFGEYNGVRVGVVLDGKGGGTAFPDRNKQP